MAKDKTGPQDERIELDTSLEIARLVARETGIAMAREMTRLLRPDLIEADEAKASREPEDDDRRHKVRVFCSAEKGFFRAGKHWPQGWTSGEVTTAELRALEDEHGRRNAAGKVVGKLILESL